ncbi:MAG: isoaspartyl peptidase/L-asparaginase [Ignavibacteriaceae bacterium]|nr:isoaspartyl peptidase/L-asparaginase [Ignavibacteriaceae bacterium]
MKLTIGIALLCFSLILAQPEKNGGNSPRYVLVLHGGAGGWNRDVFKDSIKLIHKAGIEKALKAGTDILKAGGTALDAVEQAVKILEDDPLFNAGRGAVLTTDGIAELDASIMSGRDKSAGAVASVTKIKNPITAARAVMEKSPHVMLSATGAERFAGDHGLELVENSYFITDETLEIFRKRKATEEKKGTVGAVALDKDGNLAAATSTGGMMFKKPGRIGDAPIIGAGNYADNRTCAVSCTGKGEKYIKNAVAFHISALMEYKGFSLSQAVDYVMDTKLEKGDGGVISLDKDGNYYMKYTTGGMIRAAANSEGVWEIKIWENE